MKLATKMLLGLSAGFFAGLILQDKAIYAKPIGDIFINLIKMVSIPLILFTLSSGILSIKDGKVLKKIGTKSLLGFSITAACAATTAIIVYVIFQPGLNANLPIDMSNIPRSSNVGNNELSISALINKIIPENMLAAFVNGSILQTAFIAIFTSFTIRSLGNRHNKEIINAVKELSKLIFHMTHHIIKIAPLAAFGLTAWIVGTKGFSTLFALGALIKTILIAYFIQYLTLGLLILLMGKISPIPFYKKSIDYQIMALATGSTKATLATSIEISQKKMGVSKHTASLVLPIGASINMDAASIYLTTACLFIAQGTGVILEMHDFVSLIAMATIGTIGTAGLSGGALVILPIVITQLNLPPESFALLFAIDPFINAMRSFINITGDTAVALIVDKTENKLNLKQYYS